jgi:co-chaperonin GroES (HSP10)
MKLVPLYNKVIVDLIPEADERKSESGIILVSKQNPYYRGKVTAVGKGHYQNAQRIAMDVETGQVILFLKNSGMGVEFDFAGNVTKILLADTDIYAVEVEE